MFQTAPEPAGFGIDVDADVTGFKWDMIEDQSHPTVLHFGCTIQYNLFRWNTFSFSYFSRTAKFSVITQWLMSSRGFSCLLCSLLTCLLQSVTNISVFYFL